MAKKKPDLIDTYNDFTKDVNTLADYIEAMHSIFRPSGDGARGAVEEEVKEHFATMRKKMQRMESLLMNKIWED
jgi:hypothetical protein